MSDAFRKSSLDSPSGQGGSLLFAATIVLVVVGGIAAIAVIASTRESNLGVAPESQDDHWHSAYVINNCGVDLPPTLEFESPLGIHTHGDGLLHVHPFSPAAAGRNATLGVYFEGYGAELTDTGFTTGPADITPVSMTEEDGCDGEPAELQLAVWRDAFDEEAEPEIITEDLAGFVFDEPGMAITLGLVPEGETPERPPADRISALEATGIGAEPGAIVDAETDDAETDDAETDDAETDDAEGEPASEEESE